MARGLGTLIIFMIGVCVVYGLYWANRAQAPQRMLQSS
jgi:cbb3-type cytochrome oxidase subunit 3